MFRYDVIAVGLAATILNTGVATAQSYTEDFTSTTYKDTIYTTADWNTAAGELRLFPFAPTLIATFDTPGSSFGVAVDGDFAFVADQLSGLQVIDISDPSAPGLLGSLDTSGSALGVASSGKRVLVCDSASGLHIIDVSNPGSPVLLGTYDTPGFATDVAVAGEHAFVADYNKGLQVIDISNPSLPTLAGSLSTPGNATGIAVDGNHALITDESLGLQVVDITVPSNPVSIGFLDTAGTALGVAVDGDHAFVADGGNGLLVVDVGKPTEPFLIGSYSSPGTARSVAVTGNRVFLADDSSGLQVVDITDPTNPTFLHGYDTTGQARDVVVNGSHAIVADASSGMQVIEIAQVIDTPALVGTYSSPGSPFGVAIEGDHAFVGSGSLGLEVIDISDLSNPTLVGSFNTPQSASEIVIAGNHAYVSDGTSVQILDIADPTNPTFVGSYVSSVHAHVVDGDLALFTSDGVDLLDVSDPANPTFISTLDVPGAATDIAVSGDHAFVTAWPVGIKVADISDPSNPVIVGSVDMPDDPNGLTVSGDFVYVCVADSGLQIVDVSVPENPVLAGRYQTSGRTFAVSVVGDYAFVAENSGGGLQVIDVSDPDNPTLVGSYVSFSNWGVAVAGNHAFVVGGGEMQVIQVFQEEFVARDNIGQSLSLYGGTDTIVRARISSTQTTGVTWELSANGGTSFESFLPGEAAVFANPGNDLRWRSTHSWAPGLDPTVSSLAIDWFHDSARIEVVNDIPNDQGRQVRVTWTRSGHDFVGDPTPIVEYAVYRRIDPNLSKPLASTSQDKQKGWSAVALAHAAWMQSNGWDYLTSVPALVEDSYSVVVPTLGDSTNEGTYYTTLRVTALTDTPGLHYHSQPDSGYSVDNLAPGAPQNLVADYGQSQVILDWDDAPESDFRYYRVYRSSDPDFTPGSENLLTETANSDYNDAVPNPQTFYYKVSVVDFSGNEGPAAEPSTPTPVPEWRATRFELNPASPNPFNPSTRLSFELAVAGPARLEIFDATGRLVATPIQDDLVAGRHELIWDGVNAAGRRLASGVYLYRLEAGGKVQTRRMTLLK